MVVSDIEMLLRCVEEWADASNAQLSQSITAAERNALMQSVCAKAVGAWEIPFLMQSAILVKCDEMRYARVTESHRLRQLLERERDELLQDEIRGIIGE